MMIPESVSTDEAKTEAEEIKQQLGEEWVYFGCFKIHPANLYNDFLLTKSLLGGLRV